MIAVLRGRGKRASPWPLARGLLLALGVALVVYLPWAILVQVEMKEEGGYKALLAHTRGLTSFWQTPPKFLLECASSFMSPAVLVLAAVGAAAGALSARPQARLVMLVLAAFGTIQMAIPYRFMVRGLRTISSQEAVAIGLLEPVLLPTWVLLVWDEVPAWWTVVGATLILTGLILRYMVLRQWDVKKPPETDLPMA